MQVSLEATTGLERRLTIGVPSAEIDQEVNNRLQKAAKTVRIDGFRAGKVPMKVVRQRFGAGVRQEVIGEVLNRSFYEAVEQEKLQPAGQPSIESVKDEAGQDLEFVATFEVYPEIAVADLSEVKVVRPVAEVTDADIEKMIENLRKQQGKQVAVDRAAVEGDTVKIDYVGRRDGEEFEGGSAEDATLGLGSGRMIPGFEDAIVGMKAGEEKVVPLTFPEDYHAEDLKGAEVEFTIKLNSVLEQQLAELNDEFFALFGVSEGGEEKFREEVRANMERELNNAVRNKVKGRVMEQLLKLHTVELPSGLVSAEINQLKRQMLQQFGGDSSGFDPSILPDDLFKPQAERRTALGLIIAELVKVADVKAEAEKVRAKIEEIASTYEEPEEVVRYYYGNQQLLSSVESLVLEDSVVEHILSQAEITDEPCSYEEAMQPDPEPGTEEADEADAS